MSINLADFVIDKPKFYPIGTWVEYDKAVNIYNFDETRALVHTNIHNGKTGYRTYNRKAQVDIGLLDRRRQEYMINQAQRNIMYISYFYSISQTASMFVKDYKQYNFRSARSFLSKSIYEVTMTGKRGMIDDFFDWSNKFLADYTKRTEMENNHINLKYKYWDEESMLFQMERLKKNGHTVDKEWLKRIKGWNYLSF